MRAIELRYRRLGSAAAGVALALAASAAPAGAESRCGVGSGSRVYVEPRSGAERVFVTRVRDGAIAFAYGRTNYVTTLPRVSRAGLVAFGAPEDHGEIAIRVVAPKTCAPGKSARRLKCKMFGPPAAGLVSVQMRRPSGKPVSAAIYQRGALVAFADAGVSWRWIVPRGAPVRAPSQRACYLPAAQS